MTGKSLHSRVVLERCNIAELVESLPESLTLGVTDGDALICPPGQVLRIERDLEAGLTAERGRHVGECGAVEIESNGGRLGEQGRLDLHKQALGAGFDFHVA